MKKYFVYSLLISGLFIAPSIAFGASTIFINDSTHVNVTCDTSVGFAVYIEETGQPIYTGNCADNHNLVMYDDVDPNSLGLSIGDPYYDTNNYYTLKFIFMPTDMYACVGDESWLSPISLSACEALTTEPVQTFYANKDGSNIIYSLIPASGGAFIATSLTAVLSNASSSMTNSLGFSWQNATDYMRTLTTLIVGSGLGLLMTLFPYILAIAFIGGCVALIYSAFILLRR